MDPVPSAPPSYDEATNDIPKVHSISQLNPASLGIQAGSSAFPDHLGFLPVTDPGNPLSTMIEPTGKTTRCVPPYVNGINGFSQSRTAAKTSGNQAKAEKYSPSSSYPNDLDAKNVKRNKIWNVPSVFASVCVFVSLHY